jgi:hypothetical protein
MRSRIVQFDKLENDSPDEQIVSVLTQAHVYQIGASAADHRATSGIARPNAKPDRRVVGPAMTQLMSTLAPRPGLLWSISRAATRKRSPNTPWR